MGRPAGPRDQDNANDEELTLRAFRNSHLGNRVVVLRDGAETGG